MVGCTAGPPPRDRRPPRRLTRLLPTPGNGFFTLVMISLLIAAQSVGALPLGRPASAPAVTSTGTIAYQGRLADSAGAPLTGTYNMIFRLYDAATGGAPLWEEQWTGSNGVKVSDGLFNVMLGSLTAMPQAAIAGHDQLFLGITVGTDDEMAPRVQLGSVPYATQALTVPDGSVTTATIADGAVTQAKLGSDVSLTPPDGSITTAKIADGAVTATKLGLQNGSVCLGSEANVSLPGNWEREPIPGMALSFSLPSPGRILVWSISSTNTLLGGPTNNTYVGTDTYLDGTAVIGDMRMPPNTGWYVATSMKLIEISAGSHVLDLRAYTQFGAAAVNYGAGSCLQYLVFNG